MVTVASGAVLRPCCVITALTASVGVGWVRASAGERVSMGLPPSAAKASSTFCISGAATVASTLVVASAVAAGSAAFLPQAEASRATADTAPSRAMDLDLIMERPSKARGRL